MSTARSTIRRRRAGTAVAGMLAGDAILHAAWACGLTWPASDPTALSHAVLNTDVPFTPRVLLPLVGLLAVASAGVYAYSRDVEHPGLRRIGRTISCAVTAGLAARGAAGFVWIAGVGADPGSAFYRLNAAVYTPACLVFGGLAAGVAGIPRRRSAVPA